MTPAWISLWTRAMDISTGAPEVVARRLHLMRPEGLWSPATWIEMQQMVIEKMVAAAESGWALYSAAVAPVAWAGAAQWWAPAHQRRLTHHAVRSAHRALDPVSRRVKANVKRLRQG